MKKILAILAIGAMLATTASADLGRVEMGVGIWQQTPNGASHIEDSSGLLDLKGDYSSDEKDSSEAYLWMLIKHPLPILPNIRLEYVSIADEGNTEGEVGDAISVTGDGFTTINMTQYDIIPYYNILDNTGWITVDLGLDIKIIDTTGDVVVVDGGAYPSTTESFSDNTVVPLLYLRTRVEIPATNIGLEADVKYITDGDSTVYDIRAKVDYTLDFIPVIQPALELGYRIQKFDLEDSDTNNKTDLEFSGVYAGLMVRF